MTSLLQQLKQGIIRNVRATNPRQVFETFRAAIDADPKTEVMDSWKSFSIAFAVYIIKAVMDELKAETVNA
jgi:hypothetical protein